MATEKKQSFLGGAAVLAFGIMAVKVIGAVFKIPLRNILGEGGSADFSNAYNIYATMLTISTAGLPVALSKLVSEAYARGRTRQAQRTFNLSLTVFLLLGLVSFSLMWWGNDYLASLLNNPRAAYGIRALAPAVVCVGCLSAFRGYAQGRQYMTPTAVSQILEALCKLVFGLALSLWLLKIGQPDYIAAAGAIGGVTIGTILSLVYMAANYLRHRPALQSGERCASGRAIVRRLLALAIPITIASSMVSIITLIDTSLVQGQLQNALGYSLDETRALYGNYSACMAHGLGHPRRLRLHHAAQRKADRAHRALVLPRHGAARLPDGAWPVVAQRPYFPSLLSPLRRCARRAAALGARHREHLRLPDAHHKLHSAILRAGECSHLHHAHRRRCEDRAQL